LAKQQKILVAALEDVVLVRIVGYGDRDVAYSLNFFLEGLLRQSHKKILMDFKDCSWVDSTFMGVMVSNGIEAKSLGGWFRVVQASEHARYQMELIGLHEVIEICTGGDLLPDLETKELEIEKPEKLKQMEFIRDYHQILMNLNQKNVETFGVFVGHLSAELANCHKKEEG